MFNLASYIPESLLPQYEAVREGLLSGLELLGIVKPNTKAADAEATRAKQAYNDAEHSLTLTRDELETAQDDLNKLFDPEWYGKDGEWKKLYNTCLEKEVGE